MFSSNCSISSAATQKEKVALESAENAPTAAFGWGVCGKMWKSLFSFFLAGGQRGSFFTFSNAPSAPLPTTSLPCFEVRHSTLQLKEATLSLAGSLATEPDERRMEATGSGISTLICFLLFFFRFVYWGSMSGDAERHRVRLVWTILPSWSLNTHKVSFFPWGLQSIWNRSRTWTANRSHTDTWGRQIYTF